VTLKHVNNSQSFVNYFHFIVVIS